MRFPEANGMVNPAFRICAGSKSKAMRQSFKDFDPDIGSPCPDPVNPAPHSLVIHNPVIRSHTGISRGLIFADCGVASILGNDCGGWVHMVVPGQNIFHLPKRQAAADRLVNREQQPVNR